MVSGADLEAYLGRAWRIDKLPIKYPSRKYAFIASLILLGIVARRRDTKAA
jgi:hypothetical protein